MEYTARFLNLCIVSVVGRKVIDNAAKTTFRRCVFEHYTLLRYNCTGNFNVRSVVAIVS